MSSTEQSIPPPTDRPAARRLAIARRGSVPAVSADAIEHTIRHTALRGLGFIGLLAIALIHLLDVIGKIKETPYLGAMYILLMLASIVVAFAIVHTGSPSPGRPVACWPRSR